MGHGAVTPSYLVWKLDTESNKWTYTTYITFDEAWDHYSQLSDDIAVLDYSGDPVLSTRRAQEVIENGEDWFTGA